jgi:hypothetical protein
MDNTENTKKQIVELLEQLEPEKIRILYFFAFGLRSGNSANKAMKGGTNNAK